MRILLTAVMLLILTATGTTQSFSKFSLGGSLHGLYTGSFNTSASNDMVTATKTYSAYADSVKPYESGRLTLGATVWAHLFINKRWGFQGGVGYLDVGFKRTQSNIQYLDPLYPGIGQGKLMELSSGSGEKSVVYSYRYQYLQVPLLFHYEVYNSRDFYYKISLTAGAGFNFLLNHEIKAELSQFVVEGQDVFHLDSTGYEGKAFTVNLMFGAKGEYRLDKKTIVYLMPVIGIYPVSVSSTPMQVYPYYFQINAGFQYAIQFTDEKK